MNARDALITRQGNRRICRMCEGHWNSTGFEMHSSSCPVEQLITQFDAMQKVCDAASLAAWDLEHLSDLQKAVAELDKTKGE